MNLRDKLRAVGGSTGAGRERPAEAGSRDCGHLAVYRPMEEFSGAMEVRRDTVARISGLDLPFSYEVHFSNEELTGQTITMIGDEDGVAIPDQFISSNDVSCPEWIQYFKYQIFIRIPSVASALEINAKKASLNHIYITCIITIMTIRIC